MLLLWHFFFAYPLLLLSLPFPCGHFFFLLFSFAVLIMISHLLARYLSEFPIVILLITKTVILRAGLKTLQANGRDNSDFPVFVFQS